MHMDSAKKTRANKAKISEGVTKALKKNSIPGTMAAMGAKKEASGIAAAAKLIKQAQAVRKSVSEEERKAEAIINKLAKAAARHTLERKKNTAAVAQQKKVRSTGAKRKSPPAAVSAAAKKARVTKSSSAAAKRKVDELKTQESQNCEGQPCRP